MGSLVNSYSNAASRRKHLSEIDLEFAPGLPQGWLHLHRAIFEKHRQHKWTIYRIQSGERRSPAPRPCAAQGCVCVCVCARAWARERERERERERAIERERGREIDREGEREREKWKV